MLVGRKKQLDRAEEFVRQSLHTSRSWHMAVFGPRGCGRSAFLQEVGRRAEQQGVCPLYAEVETPSMDAIMAALQPEVEKRLGAAHAQYVRENADAPLVLAELASRLRNEGRQGLLVLLDLGRAMDARHRSEDIRAVATWLRVLINWLVNNPSPLILAVGSTSLVLEEDRIAREAADVFRDRLSGRIWLGNDFDEGAFAAFREIARQRVGVELPEADALTRLGGLTVGRLLEVLEGAPKGHLSLQDLWKLFTDSVPPVVPFPPAGKTLPRDVVPKLDWPSLVLTNQGIPADPGAQKLVSQGVLRETAARRLVPGKDLSTALGFTPPEYQPNVRERALIRLQDPEDDQVGHDVLEGLRRLVAPYVEARASVQMWTARTGRLVVELAASLPSVEIPADLLPRPLNVLLLFEMPRANVFDEMESLFDEGEWFAVLRHKELSSLREEPGFRSKRDTEFYKDYPRLEVELQEEEAVALLTAGEGAEPDAGKGAQLLERLLMGPIAQLQRSRPFLPVTSNHRLLGILVEHARPLSAGEVASAAGMKEAKAREYLKALQSAGVLPKSRRGTFEWSPFQDGLLSCLLEGPADGAGARLQRKFTLPAAARRDPLATLAALYRPLTASLDGETVSRAVRGWVLDSLRLRQEALAAAIGDVESTAVGDMKKSVRELREKVEAWKARHGLDGGLFPGDEDTAREALDSLAPLEDGAVQLAAERESKLKDLMQQARKRVDEAKESLKQFRSAHPNARPEEVERQLGEVENALGKPAPAVDSLLETLVGLARKVEGERKKGSLLAQRLQTFKGRADKAVKFDVSGAREVRNLRDAADNQVKSGDWESAEESLKQLDDLLKAAESEMTLQEMLPVAPPPPPRAAPTRTMVKPATPTPGPERPTVQPPAPVVRQPGKVIEETPPVKPLPANETPPPRPAAKAAEEDGTTAPAIPVVAGTDEAGSVTHEIEAEPEPTPPVPESVQWTGTDIDELADLLFRQGMEVVACKLEVETSAT